jgi:hypothetical protein
MEQTLSFILSREAGVRAMKNNFKINQHLAHLFIFFLCWCCLENDACFLSTTSVHFEMITLKSDIYNYRECEPL